MARKTLISALRNGDVAIINELHEESDGPLLLDGETFSGVQLTDLELDNFDLSNTEWDECMLDRVRFGNANLEGAFFNGCTFLGCTFEGTNLDGAALDGCVLRRVRLADAQLSGTEISNSQFVDSELCDLTLEDVEWRALSVTEGSITNITGASGTLSGLTLRSVKIDGFDTSGLTVERCSASGVEGATPAGFIAREGRRQKV